MNAANLKAYAPKVRRDFIAAVSKHAQKYGATAKAPWRVCVPNT